MNTLDFELDRTGFPMLWVESVDAYVHWLPVTKVQFEYFLCAEPDSQFDANWYDTILQINARVSPNSISPRNYWGAFMTGLLPQEVSRFASWCGAGYAIPTLEEWNRIYRYLKAYEPRSGTEIDGLSKRAELQPMPPRVQRLLSRLNDISAPLHREVENQFTLVDQMFMRFGVLEWVESNDLRNRWGGMGQTHSDFHGGFFTPEHGQPSRPTDPEGMRLHHYGFRLLRRRR